MKPCTAAMLNLLDSAQGTDSALLQADLYTFQLANGTQFFITDFDHPLTITYPSFGGPLAAATVHAGGGGAGYAVGDLSYVSGGLGLQGQVLICTVSAGAVTSVVVFQGGNGYFTTSAAATNVLTGSGNGALTLDITAYSDTRTGTVTFSADETIYPLPDKEGIEMKHGLGIEVDTFTMKLDAGPANVISGSPILQQFVQGQMDNCLIQIERTFMTQPAQGALPVVAYGTIPLFQGNISDINEVGRTHAQFEVKDRREKLNIPMPYNLFQPSCRWQLYSAGCTLIKANFAVAGTVASGSGALQLNVTGPGNATGYFNQGTCLFTSGANSGLSISIRGWISGSPNVLLLYKSAPNVPAAGDSITLYPGCPKTFSACSQQFQATASWASVHLYHVGDRIFDGAHTQYCIVQHTSGGSAPGWDSSVGGITIGNWLNTGQGNELNMGGFLSIPVAETAV